jgi:lipoprotein NlpD
VPAGTRDGVLAALAPRRAVVVSKGGNAGRATAAVHVVRPRDTLVSIAKQYGVSVGDVLRWNSLENQDRIQPGDRLRVAELR